MYPCSFGLKPMVSVIFSADAVSGMDIYGFRQIPELSDRAGRARVAGRGIACLTQRGKDSCE